MSSSAVPQMISASAWAFFDKVGSGPPVISTLMPVSVLKTSATFLKAVFGPPAP